MTEILFWAMGGIITYVYAGYPLLLLVMRVIRGGQPVRAAEHTPPVTLIISAYNEVDVIGEKLANSLALDFPTDRFEILVVSDASSDGTDRIVEQADEARVRLLRMPERGGKTLGLNQAVRHARGEILVFSDANAMYLRDALIRLVRSFADPDVGAVVGESTYAEAEAGAAKGESLYWRYEVAIKRLESAVGSVVGGDGAIYAVRRDFYADMPADALSDFVNPLQIVQRGYRCVYEPQARSVEKAAGDFKLEFRRKVRIVNRAWRALMSLKSVLNPFKFGFFAIQILSHKLLRWLVPVFLIVLLIANVILLGKNRVYDTILAAQLALYGLAAIGYLLQGRARVPRVFTIPFYFVMVNLASALGIVEAYLGKTYTTWTTARARGQ